MSYKTKEKANKQQRKYYKNNKEKIKVIHKRYALKNKGKIAERKKLYKQNNKVKIRKQNKLYREKAYFTPKYQYKKYKEMAKRRNKEFNLSFEEFEKYWQGNCYYCGDKIETVGLDRVDNEKGYEISNIERCCRRCNIMKNVYSKDDFVEHCKKIISNFS